MSPEASLTPENEKYPYKVSLGPESVFAMARISNRLGNSSDVDTFRRGFTVLDASTDIALRQREIISVDPITLIAESVNSPILEAARTGRFDALWWERYINAVRSGTRFVFVFDDGFADYISGIVDRTGIIDYEPLAIHSITLLDLFTNRVSRGEVLGEFDREKEKVGPITLEFLPYKMPQHEIYETLTRIKCVVPVNLNDPL